MLVKRLHAPKTHEARHDSSSHRASSCPSWARTRTLLIQSQACCQLHQGAVFSMELRGLEPLTDRKSTRLNSSHGYISYAVFCLKKKKNVQVTRRFGVS